mgnify:CR=1 FL=1
METSPSSLPNVRYSLGMARTTVFNSGSSQFYINLKDTAEWPRLSLATLIHHEGAPGHHFQLALVAQSDLPKLRQNMGFSANTEGWALYAEQLAMEIGMYEGDDLGLLGMYQARLFRASRCVVDTGIHAKGWSREQAQRYLHDNTAMGDHEIETEVDRYIAWPGQALSYYMGMLAFEEGRARAEKALGPKFNIRAFHDAVLAIGSAPIPVIQARIDQLIADGGKGPYPDEE